MKTWNPVAFFFSTSWLFHQRYYHLFLIAHTIGIGWTVFTAFVDISFWVHLGLASLIAFFIGFIPRSNVSPAKFRWTCMVHIVLAACYAWTNWLCDSIPTKTNAINVIRNSEEGVWNDLYLEHPKWEYVKQENDDHIIQLMAYDPTAHRHVLVEYHTNTWKHKYNRTIHYQ